MPPEPGPLLHLPPSLRGFRPRHVVFSTWMDHLPFGYDLITEVRPRRVVELGTQAGLSYFCFCQAVEEQGLPTRCSAIDTWAGDAHTGAYDDATFREVERHNERYLAFSELLRMRFEDALHRFPDGSMDLLHVDGLHTYDAVRLDHETWRAKVAPGGLILFHDVVARMHDFGVFRFWEELAPRGDAFLFTHGFGLGVVRVPGGDRRPGPLEAALFDPDPGAGRALRGFYEHAARHHDALRKDLVLDAVKDRVRAARG